MRRLTMSKRLYGTIMLPPLISVCMLTSALASQGPGTLPGTASVFTQTVVAILVYGACATIILAGAVIGAARRLAR